MTAIATRPNVLALDGQIFTSSIDIASLFGKRHDNVLRAIRNMAPDLPQDYYLRNFEEVMAEFSNGKGGIQSAPAYRITRDGFVLLAMGFTGKTALQFKVAYIEEFNRMEAELRRQSLTLTAAQKRDLQKAVADRAHAIGGAREDYATIYRALKDHFEVPTYGDIPTDRFDEALSVVASTGKGVAKLTSANAMRLEQDMQFARDVCNHVVRQHPFDVGVPIWTKAHEFLLSFRLLNDQKILPA